MLNIKHLILRYAYFGLNGVPKTEQLQLWAYQSYFTQIIPYIINIPLINLIAVELPKSKRN